ncbi:MAG: hypothetical protein ABI373_03835 [Flavobacteriales bacterium]
MSEQKGYERMHELIGSLRSALGRLEEGKLDPEGLEHTVEEARKLYERLVVIRHKAREAALIAAQKPKVNAVVEPPVVPEAAPIRLDTRPPEPSPHQTSLIDAIAETESVPPEEPAPVAVHSPVKVETEKVVAEKIVPEKVAPEKPRVAKPKPTLKERPETVAAKLEHAPVADLHKAIALSQKFWFVAELFAGQREQYDKAIDALNNMGGLAEAQAYVEREVVGKLPKPPGEDVLATFTELLQRRYR